MINYIHHGKFYKDAKLQQWHTEAFQKEGLRFVEGINDLKAGIELFNERGITVSIKFNPSPVGFEWHIRRGLTLNNTNRNPLFKGVTFEHLAKVMDMFEDDRVDEYSLHEAEEFTI